MRYKLFSKHFEPKYFFEFEKGLKGDYSFLTFSTINSHDISTVIIYKIKSRVSLHYPEMNLCETAVLLYFCTNWKQTVFSCYEWVNEKNVIWSKRVKSAWSLVLLNITTSCFHTNSWTGLHNVSGVKLLWYFTGLAFGWITLSDQVETFTTGSCFESCQPGRTSMRKEKNISINLSTYKCPSNCCLMCTFHLNTSQKSLAHVKEFDDDSRRPDRDDDERRTLWNLFNKRKIVTFMTEL